VEAGWAILKTQPRRDALAAQAVRARGLQSYVPRLPSRRGMLWVPLFPGYLFAEIERGRDDLLRIRAAPGAAYILPRAGQPALLRDAMIQAIRTRERELSLAGAAHAFSHGEAVRVKAGPFKWIEGLFDRRLSASGRVLILLNLVHECAAVDIDAVNLEPPDRFSPHAAAAACNVSSSAHESSENGDAARHIVSFGGAIRAVTPRKLPVARRNLHT
jgi:transcriptional antiterminator RfaH